MTPWWLWYMPVACVILPALLTIIVVQLEDL